MSEKKSYFAGYDDMNFFGNGALCKLLIDFDCLFKGEWKAEQTELEDEVVETFKNLVAIGYNLYLSEVPERQEILDWLDSTFDYDFICNEEPNRYTDSCDHWTTVSRKIETKLCSEGGKNSDRYIHFDGNWEEIFNLIKENDVVAQTESAWIMYDDIDWNQLKEENGLSNGDGNQCFGGSYVPVEKMNAKTTEFLKKIAKPRTEYPVSYSYKYINERWYIQSIFWDVNEEIGKKYGVKIEIEQGSLYYRGTWLEVKVKAPYKDWKDLIEICRKFCSDYGLDSRKELIILNGYELPWPDGQKKREEEDDRTDSFFDSMDDD